MRTITIGSERYYDLNENQINSINNSISIFNRAIFSAYNLFFLKEINEELFNSKYDKSIHMHIKDKYGLNDYYANSAVQLAKGKLSSQKELLKDYKKNKQTALKAVIDKKEKYQKDLIDFLELLDNLHIYQISIKNNPKVKLKKKQKYISVNGYIITVRTLKEKKIISTDYGLYEFEYKYLIPRIHKIKSIISNLIYRENKLKEEISNLKLKRIIFGSKKLMRENHSLLREKKYKEFQVSGRNDAKYGNFVFKLIENNLEITLIDKSKLVLKDIRFPYKKEELKSAINEKIPICFTLKKKKDKKNGRVYYQIFVSFDINSVKRINTDISTGIFGMDFNYGHLDVSEIDGKGNLLGIYIFPYEITDNSNINEQNLRKALNEVGKLVKSKNKCLVIEDLDTKNSKRRSTYREPVTNRIFHMFSYARYIDMVEYLGSKYEFDIIKVNPAFTSVIGKIKYGYERKINIHKAASYVIARRGLGFKEKVLKKYRPLIKELGNKHYWSKWNKINKLLKEQKVYKSNLKLKEQSKEVILTIDNY